MASSNSKNRWYQNDGSQQFTPLDVHVDDNDTRSIIPFDLDNDGDLDLVAGNFNEKNRWYENTLNTRGSPVYHAHDVYSSLNTSYGILPAFIDQDGFPDLMEYNGNQTNYWYVDLPASVNQTAVTTAQDTYDHLDVDDLLRVFIEHAGHSVDNAIEVARLYFTFTVDGEAMTDSQARMLFDDLCIYHSSDDSWTSGDTYIVSIPSSHIDLDGSGRQEFMLPESSYTAITYSESSAGSQGYFFLVANFSSLTGTITFRVSYDPDNESVMQDQISDSEIVTGHTNIVTSGEIEIPEFPSIFLVTLATVLIFIPVRRRRFKGRIKRGRWC